MLDGFVVRMSFEVRFRDTDMLGHVNNAVYLTYFESARMHYWRELDPQFRFGHVPFILARAETDFLAEVRAGQRLALGIRVSRLGTKSFDFEYELVREPDGERVATGRSVQVMYDYERAASYVIPEEVRQRIVELEGRSIDGG